MPYAVGIDLGTSNSEISVYRRGMAETLPVEGRATFPSVVSFLEDGTVLAGYPAKGRVLVAPQETVVSVKRFMGDRSKAFQVHGRSYSPVEIAAIILDRLSQAAKKELGQEISDAVISVPAYFNEKQLEDTKRAGEAAHLNVLRLVPEPSAAAIAYGLDREKDQTILVYDLGGGTFDVSILEVRCNHFEVRAVGGDSHLGGDDFDEAIVKVAAEKFKDATGIDVLADTSLEGAKARQRLKSVAEAAKIELSEFPTARLSIPDCLGAPLDFEISLEEYNGLILPYLKQTVGCLKSVLADAGLDADEIDRVILVGGSTRNRLVRQIVAEEIKEPYVAERVDEIVSHGAAIVAGSLFVPEEDKAPMAIEDLKDVTGHAFGVDCLDKEKVLVFRTVIPRQTSYPCRRGILVSTAVPFQEIAQMGVYRNALGEDERLGRLDLPIEPPQGELVPIGAIFELDRNGIIHFTAVQLPVGSARLPLEEHAERAGGELDLSATDSLIRSGEAKTKSIDVKIN